MERVAAVRGAEDRAPARLESADVARMEAAEPVGREKPVVAVEYAVHLPAVFEDRGAHDAADDGVETGAIAAAGEYRDALDRCRLGPGAGGGSASRGLFSFHAGSSPCGASPARAAAISRTGEPSRCGRGAGPPLFS